MEVIVYTTPTCPYCHSVKQFLAQRRIPFTERNVAADPRAATEMVQLTGQQGVPVTVIGSEVIIGFDRPRLEQALSRAAAAGPIRLGAEVADAEAITRQRGQEVVRGAYVGNVKAGSLAARIGLQADDIIVEMAGQPVQNAGDLERALRSLQPGSVATISFLRNGRRERMQFMVQP